MNPFNSSPNLPSLIRQTRHADHAIRRAAWIEITRFVKAEHRTAQYHLIEHYLIPRLRCKARRLLPITLGILDVDELVQKTLTVCYQTCIARYDPDQGTTFWGYSRKWFTGHMIGEVGSALGLTGYQRSKWKRIRDIAARLEQTLERPATPTEIADAYVKKYGGNRPRPRTIQGILNALHLMSRPTDSDQEHRDRSYQDVCTVPQFDDPLTWTCSGDPDEWIRLIYSNASRIDSSDNTVGGIVLHALRRVGIEWQIIEKVVHQKYPSFEVKVSLLPGAEPGPFSWPDLHKSLTLPEIVPTDWTQVREVFRDQKSRETPAPFIKKDALRKKLKTWNEQMYNDIRHHRM